MKRSIILSLVMAAMLAVAVPGLACEGPDCTINTDTDVLVNGGVASIPFTTTGPNGSEDFATTQGYVGFDLEASAAGSKFAYAEVNGYGNWEGRFAGAFQKEIGGGELSGAGGLSVTDVHANGMAIGIDDRRCEVGADFADVDLAITAGAYQANGAYSDDGAKPTNNWIGGFNESQSSVWAQTDSTDYGADDYYTREYMGTRWERYRFSGSRYAGNGWYYKDYYRTVKHEDLEADAYDGLSATAITGGATLVYAYQGADFSTVKGVTGNFATGFACGDEHIDINVSGNGNMAGVALLDNGAIGAGFNSSFSYDGKNFGAGVAGGSATIERTNGNGHMSVSVNATGFSAATVGGGYNPQ